MHPCTRKVPEVHAGGFLKCHEEKRDLFFASGKKKIHLAARKIFYLDKVGSCSKPFTLNRLQYVTGTCMDMHRIIFLMEIKIS